MNIGDSDTQNESVSLDVCHGARISDIKAFLHTTSSFLSKDIQIYNHNRDECIDGNLTLSDCNIGDNVRLQAKISPDSGANRNEGNFSKLNKMLRILT